MIPLALVTLATAAPPADGRSLLDFVRQGGSIGTVIVGVSIIGLALFIAQWLRLRTTRVCPPELAAALRDDLAEGRLDTAQSRCDADASLLAVVVGKGLARARRSAFGLLELREAMEEAGAHESARLERLSDGVALVAAVAPMLGLLGTVVGMVGAFDALSIADGPARPESLAGSISVALITTVLGLVVAIPATVAHALLRTRLEDAVGQVEEVAEQLASLVRPEDAGAAA